MYIDNIKYVKNFRINLKKIKKKKEKGGASINTLKKFMFLLINI